MHLKNPNSIANNFKKNLVLSSHYLLDTPMNEVRALESPSGAMLQGRNELPN